MNKYFNCRTPLKSSNMMASNGVTAIINNLIFTLCDEGDIILLPTPSYGGLVFDAMTKNGISVVHVPCDDIPYARFCGSIGAGECTADIVERFERAFEKERAYGKKVSAVLLANPENPLGRSYSPDVLFRIAQFCEHQGLHLIVDEIFAMSGGQFFSSILSLDLASNRHNVHVVWGMSKVRKYGACSSILLRY